jgi:hypothetical protein
MSTILILRRTLTSCFLLPTIIAGALCAPVEAQMAHFSWVQAEFDLGFSNGGGVAVDASGNIYVADTGNNAIKEILAPGGAIPISPM